MQNLSKILRPSQQDQTTSLLGESLDEKCKRATDKQMTTPDSFLIQEVINLIKTAGELQLNNRDIAICLRRRLHQDSVHKQLLAVHLVKAVLDQCRNEVGEIYIDDLLHHVAMVATRTNKRMHPEFPETKRQALDLLRQYGRRGQHALQMAVRSGGNRSFGGEMDGGFNSRQELGYDYNQEDVFANQNMGRPAILEGGGRRNVSGGGGRSIIEEVRVIISQANSFIDLMQDLILSKSSNEKSKKMDDDFDDEALIKELIENTRKLKDKLPKLLEKLQRVPGPEAEATIFQSIEALDVLENAIKLHAEIMEESRKDKSRPKTTTQPKSTAKSTAPQPQTSTVEVADLLSFNDDPPVPTQPTQQQLQPYQAQPQTQQQPYQQQQAYPQQSAAYSQAQPVQQQIYGQQQAPNQQYGASQTLPQQQSLPTQQSSYGTNQGGYQNQYSQGMQQPQTQNTQALVLYNQQGQSQAPNQAYNQYQQNQNMQQPNQTQTSSPYLAITNSTQAYQTGQPAQQNYGNQGQQQNQYGYGNNLNVTGANYNNQSSTSNLQNQLNSIYSAQSGYPQQQQSQYQATQPQSNPYSQTQSNLYSQPQVTQQPSQIQKQVSMGSYNNQANTGSSYYGQQQTQAPSQGMPQNTYSQALGGQGYNNASISYGGSINPQQSTQSMYGTAPSFNANQNMGGQTQTAAAGGDEWDSFLTDRVKK